MQVGYARRTKRESVVSSGWYEGAELERHLLDLIRNQHVPEVWIRATPNGTAFILKHEGELTAPIVPGS